MYFVFALTLSYEGKLIENSRSAKNWRPCHMLVYAWWVISRTYKTAAVLDARMKEEQCCFVSLLVHEHKKPIKIIPTW